MVDGFCQEFFLAEAILFEILNRNFAGNGYLLVFRVAKSGWMTEVAIVNSFFTC